MRTRDKKRLAAKFERPAWAFHRDVSDTMFAAANLCVHPNSGSDDGIKLANNALLGAVSNADQLRAVLQENLRRSTKPTKKRKTK